MSGPRVTSGEGSRQDYSTPGNFITAVEKRFGPIQFDLAAHAGNKKHERYFAPPSSADPVTDPNAYGFDAFRFDWSQLSEKFNASSGRTPGLLWLNCEFSDVKPWALKCATESKRGANVMLLTPAAVGSNWFRDVIAGVADVYLLNGRLMFDGKNVYPKDCMVSHFHPAAKGSISVWNWASDVIHMSWKLSWAIWT